MSSSTRMIVLPTTTLKIKSRETLTGSPTPANEITHIMISISPRAQEHIFIKDILPHTRETYKPEDRAKHWLYIIDVVSLGILKQSNLLRGLRTPPEFVSVDFLSSDLNIMGVHADGSQYVAGDEMDHILTETTAFRDAHIRSTGSINQSGLQPKVIVARVTKGTDPEGAVYVAWKRADVSAAEVMYWSNNRYSSVAGEYEKHGIDFRENMSPVPPVPKGAVHFRMAHDTRNAMNGDTEMAEH